MWLLRLESWSLDVPRTDISALVFYKEVSVSVLQPSRLGLILEPRLDSCQDIWCCKLWL